jgi:hypothetical protein
MIVVIMETKCGLLKAGVQPEFFLWGDGADPEAKYNLYLILKIML